MLTEEQVNTYQKLVEIQASVQNMELTVSKFKEEIMTLFTKELEKAGGQIQTGLQQSGELQYWNLVSSVSTNVVALAGLTMLGFLAYRECFKLHGARSKTMIFSDPNKPERRNTEHALNIQSP